MTKLTIIFIKGDTTSEIDNIIDTASRGIYCHVAIKILGSVLEALGEKDESDPYPGVWKHNITKYDNNPLAVFVEVEIPDISNAEDEAQNLIGRPYGYIDCIDGGIYDIMGKQLPSDGDFTDNCSETVVRILRDGGYNILPGVEADCLTPNDIARYLTA